MTDTCQIRTIPTSHALAHALERAIVNLHACEALLRAIQALAPSAAKYEAMGAALDAHADATGTLRATLAIILSLH